jgi:membrane fusion protein, multidrug efflux system
MGLSPRSCRSVGSFGGPVLAGLFAALLLAGCDNAAAPVQGGKPVKVEVTKPIVGEVTDYQDFTGRLEAVKTVDIRARVSGYVTEAPFREGEMVKEGDLLFQIDPRPYHADLEQAEANVRQAEADRKLHEKVVHRSQQLIGTNSISREEYEQAKAAFEKAAATVGAMEAVRERARLYLDYTKVTAPASGRVGRHLVDPGNLVTADATHLTTIMTIQPMYAYFDVDERTYLDLLSAVSAKHGDKSEGLHFPVLMRLSNEDDFIRVGKVDFIDNHVTATTGTVRMRGVFDNPGEILKPGLFVRIRLPISNPYKAILVPDEAVLTDQGRKYVWVVNAKNEVEYRTVKIGQAIKDLRVVRPAEKGKEAKEGLTGTERIIISGMQRVRPGVKVAAEEQPPPVPPQSPLVRLLALHNERATIQQAGAQ